MNLYFVPIPFMRTLSTGLILTLTLLSCLIPLNAKAAIDRKAMDAEAAKMCAKAASAGSITKEKCLSVMKQYSDSQLRDVIKSVNPTFFGSSSSASSKKSVQGVNPASLPAGCSSDVKKGNMFQRCYCKSLSYPAATSSKARMLGIKVTPDGVVGEDFGGKNTGIAASHSRGSRNQIVLQLSLIHISEPTRPY